MSARLAAAALALLFIVPALPFDAPADAQVTIAKFGTGAGELTLDYPVAGYRQDANLSLQTGMIFDDCTFNVSGLPHTAGGKDYPTNVSVDVGADGDSEWEFKGTGYGALGHQTLFSNGSASTGNLSFTVNETKTANFLLPVGATTLFASCIINASPSSYNVTVNPAATLSQTLPFNSVQTFRFQWLYPTGEITRTGWVSKISLLRASGTAPQTFTNLRMTLCNTSVAALTTNFANNYGTGTPVKVIDSPSFSVYHDTQDWIDFNLTNSYYYNTTRALLVEVAFTGYTGAGYSLHYTSVAGGPVRRCYNNTNDTATIGVVDATSYKYALKVTYQDKLGLTVDIGNDSSIEFQNSSQNFTGTVLQCAQAVNNFTAAAPVSLSDAYGNDFASVPISIKMQYNGTVRLSGLSVEYDKKAKVGINPTTGNLTNKLMALVPRDLGPGNISLPIRVAVESAGKVRLGNLTIKARTPPHLATVVRIIPPTDQFINENTTLLLGIDCTDLYALPLTYSWYRNGTLQANITGNRYNFTTDYDSAGKHTVKVDVSNTMGTVSQLWNITVRNVNRPPTVDSASPPPDPSMKEGESLDFRINTSDPDGEVLRYIWYLNGTELNGVTTRFYTHATDFKSAGAYDLRVMVSDTGGLSANWSWRLTVLNVNVRPVIDNYNPKNQPRIKELDSITFSVSASDQDSQPLACTWFLNGTEMVTGDRYTHSTNYDSAGVYNVTVEVTDGELTDTHMWVLTVDNLNRLPVPVLEKPKNNLEFLDTASINFSAAGSSDPDGDSLSYRWTEAGKALSLCQSFSARFPPGEHEVGLEVSDGNGGINSTSVSFLVKFIDISVTATVDNKSPRTGNTITVSVSVGNAGDTRATGIQLEFLVDGKVRQTKNINVDASGLAKESFQWTAEEGAHKLAVRAGEQNWSGTVDVKRPGIGGAGGADIWLPLGLFIALFAVGMGVLLLSRKKKKQQPEPEQFQAPPPVAPVYAAPPPQTAYTSPEAAPPPPELAPRPAVEELPPPPPADYYSSGSAQEAPPEPSEPRPPEEDEERKKHRKKTIRIINQVSELVASIEKAGHDLSHARRALDVAMSNLKKNDFAKAVSHAKRADSLARAARDGGAKPAVARPVQAEEAAEEDKAAAEEEKRKRNKAYAIVEQVTDYILSLESAGPEMTQARRLLELSRAQLKVGNYAKAFSYAKKADGMARSVRERERVGARKQARPVEDKCPDCGQEIEEGWKLCPGCRRKL